MCTINCKVGTKEYFLLFCIINNRYDFGLHFTRYFITIKLQQYVKDLFSTWNTDSLPIQIPLCFSYRLMYIYLLR